MSRYIDADKFMKVLEEDIPLTDNPIKVMASAIAALEEQPTADVRENVKGEWIEDNSREKSMMWRCSACGQIAYYPTIGKRKGFKKHCGYNFCPNCGADMRGEA